MVTESDMERAKAVTERQIMPLVVLCGYRVAAESYCFDTWGLPISECERRRLIVHVGQGADVNRLRGMYSRPISVVRVHGWRDLADTTMQAVEDHARMVKATT